MADAHPGQRSPDGMWRWDGTAWKVAGAESELQWRPRWLVLTLRTQPTWPMLAGALCVGLIADQAFRGGAFGVAAALTIAAAALVLVFACGFSRTEPRILAACAAVFGIWLAVRASPWLLWPDAAASLVLLGLSASLAAEGSLLGLGMAEAAARTIHAVFHGVAGAVFIATPIIRARMRLAVTGPIARGVIIAAPIAIILTILLANADPVFASFFNLNVDLGRLSLDGLFVLIGALTASGLVRVASAEPLGRVDGPVWRLGAIEGLVVLTVLDVVFAAFALAQAIAAAGQAGDTLRSAGITYADYARSGFFQLLWVGGITAIVIIVFSRITGRSDQRTKSAFVVLAEAGIGLTMLIVIVAFRRLSLYEDAFGFTMLRLYSHLFAAWIGLVFVFLAADIGGLSRARRWFVGATFTSAVAVLLALNVMNPEAIVVALNIDHAGSTHKIDAGYLSQLSNDAIPGLLAATSQLDPGLRSQVVRVACAGPRSYTAGPAAYNQADADAASARRNHC
jgi:Domain of unknown function (DUF4173)